MSVRMQRSENYNDPNCPTFVHQLKICIYVAVREIESACKVVEIQPQIVQHALLKWTLKLTALPAYLPSMILIPTALNVLLVEM